MGCSVTWSRGLHAADVLVCLFGRECVLLTPVLAKHSVQAREVMVTLLLALLLLTGTGICVAIISKQSFRQN